MPFDPATVDDLGLRLYSTLPPVISELVSNAHDAESSKAEITIPEGPITPTSEVIVRDYGHGLTSDEVQIEFLPIGRKRRGKDGSNRMSKNNKVQITGRKGLGKLSAFGVATEMEVRFVKNGKAICLRLNYDKLREWPEKHGHSPYEPDFVAERSGNTKDGDGAEIRLRYLRRTKAINADEIRRGLARRLGFIGSKFQVLVNDTPIKPGDRVKKADCAKKLSWDVSEILAKGGKLATGDTVTGWIGFLAESSQMGRGVDIFAHRKAAELGSFFSFSSTHAQWARAYLVGEIHADFIDDREDLIATARNSVVWESPVGLALQDWGQAALKWAFDQWLKNRQETKEKEIVTSTGFDKWLETRLPSEQRVAQRMVRILIDDPKIDPGSAASLFDIVKSSVETVAFRELIETIEDEGANAATLLRLFDEWRIIEAREHLKLADGRLEAIEQLNHFIDEGALEVQQMQPLFENNPWLINPSWAEADGQTTYTKLLREHCVEPKDYDDKDRRIDILGVTRGSGLEIVELKRPEKTLTRRDLDQVEKYVDWARSQFKGTGGDSPKYIHGLLVVGHLSKIGDVQTKQERLAGDDIRVETFGDLHTRAKEYYRKVEKILEKIAPEYTRTKRKASKTKK